MTTRILRLLLLAALAWPTWMPATAQETTVVNDDAVSNYRVPRMVRDLKELSKVKISQETLNDDNEAQTLAQSNAIVNNEKSLTKWKFKTRNVKHASASSHIKVVRKMSYNRKWKRQKFMIGIGYRRSSQMSFRGLNMATRHMRYLLGRMFY